MKRVSIYAASLILLAAGPLADAAAQCLLANPSFELPGSSGAIFGGWYQFGSVGSSPDATHGAVAARVSGPNTGGWDVSGYWQRFDCVPGERWTASVKGWHSSSKPLTGGSKAILNIEWRNSSGELISYESHTVADASTPVGEIVEFTVDSGPAPTGTAKTHFLLGALQDPAGPVPDVYYDQATFYNLGPPTQDELQWNDFPGGRTIGFGGYTWRVKGPGYYGPGPNLFCDTESCVWVDVGGRLHVTIKKIGNSWYSTEVALEPALGYGDYIFTTVGRLDALDQHAVLGLFLWEYGRCYDTAYLWWNPYNEIDVEFSYWNNPANTIGQFVAQPYDYPGNISRFGASFADGEIASHAFRWLSDRVEFRSWRGGPGDEAPETMIHSWTYTGPHISRPEQPRVHINLWQFNGPPSTDQEVVFDAFTFIPEGAVSDAQLPEPEAASRLAAARPNPFNACAAIAYTVREGGMTEIAVYDISGRLVRTLVHHHVAAGTHEAVWDGRNDSGHRVASGLYFCRLQTGGFVETKKIVLLR